MCDHRNYKNGFPQSLPPLLAKIPMLLLQFNKVIKYVSFFFKCKIFLLMDLVLLEF